MIVVIEGVTRSGKTSICSMVSNILASQGVSVLAINNKLDVDLVAVSVREITGCTESGISDLEEFLLYSTRLSRKVKHITDNLECFDVIIIDRFVISIIVLSSYIRGINIDVISPLLNVITSCVDVDVMYYLRTSTMKVFERDIGKLRRRKNLFLENTIHSMQNGFEHMFYEYIGEKKAIDTDERSIHDISQEIASDLLAMVKSPG